MNNNFLRFTIDSYWVPFLKTLPDKILWICIYILSYHFYITGFLTFESRCYKIYEMNEIIVLHKSSVYSNQFSLNTTKEHQHLTSFKCYYFTFFLFLPKLQNF